MSIEQAEQLKREWTDKWVVVRSGVSELRRFEGLTGRVKTVNMNCRVLVEFDNPVDISWYDIDPSYLSVVDEPLPKAPPQPQAEKKSAPAKPAGKPESGSGGLSPLELARRQGATAGKADGEKKAGLSPLELARQQGAAKGESATSPDTKPASPPASSGKPLSPLELARQQGAGSGKSAPKAESPSAEVAQEQSPPAEEPPAPAVSDEDAKLSPLELARKQGALKKKD
jgi:hypothetical protein